MFPFSFQLPAFLQPSFVYINHDHSHFRIKYKVKAKLLDDSCNHKKLYPMIAKKNIMISRPSVPQRLNISMDACGEIKNFFFFDKGSTKVTATFDKDSYNVGETAHV